MAIKLIRVDDRLIHGQIVESWVPNLDIAEIVVVSNEVVEDETRRAIMRFATPEDIDLKIMSVQSVIDYFPKAIESEINVLILFPGLKEFVQLLDGGAKVSELNIGGMHYSAGKNQSIGRAMFLSEEDCAYFKDIFGRGIKIEGRGVPSDSPVDIMKVINMQ
ncbi:MAG: PTS sugar transporter subunit IIB [Elusimicrobiota bacterium]|nr:PTS sugar transporter subunit IIB [Elusimicrobiota bacterium]